MEVYREPIHFQNPQLNIKVWNFTATGQEEVQLPRWHYHPEVEFVLVLEGIHTMHTPSATYVLHPGELAIFGSSQLHRGHSEPGNRVSYIVLHVNFEPYFDLAMMHYTKYFMELVDPLDKLNAVFMRNHSVSGQVGSIIRQLHEEVMKKAKGYEIAVSMHIKHLLLTLLRHDEGLLTEHEYVRTELLHPVTSYIERNLATRIDMAEVSRLAGMSYAHFSRYFKSKLGISFIEYVNRKRIARAERLLAVRNLSVTEIAHEVGIENMSHFYELFKRISGCTPKQFREKIR